MDQFLLQFLDQRIAERLSHIVQQRVGEPRASPLKHLPDGRLGVRTLGLNLLIDPPSHVGRRGVGVLGPELQHAVTRLPAITLDPLQDGPRAAHEFLAPAFEELAVGLAGVPGLGRRLNHRRIERQRVAPLPLVVVAYQVEERGLEVIADRPCR